MKTWLLAIICMAMCVPVAMSGATINVLTGPTGWQVTSPSLVPTTPFVTDSSGFPFPPWAPAANGAPDWISPNASYVGGAATDVPGIWAFTYTFNVPTPSTPATLTGTMGFDNWLNAVLLNGNSLGLSEASSQFGGTWPVNLSGLALQLGTNELTFLVQNLAGATEIGRASWRERV